jgi:hypothetical protein
MFQTYQLATVSEEKMMAGDTSYRSIPTCPGTWRHIPDPSVQQAHLTAQYAMSRHWHEVLSFPLDKSVVAGLKRYEVSSVKSSLHSADTDGRLPCE